MTAKYTVLDSVTLTSSASSVTFSSISQDYRDLILVSNHATTGGADIRFRVNGDTGSNYSWVQMYGTGSSATSNNTTSDHFFDYGTPTSLGATISIQFMDYAATDKHKSVLARRDWASALTLAAAGRWANTSAITTILAYTAAGSFAAGSTFHLYGIAK